MRETGLKRGRGMTLSQSSDDWSLPRSSVYLSRHSSNSLSLLLLIIHMSGTNDTKVDDQKWEQLKKDFINDGLTLREQNALYTNGNRVKSFTIQGKSKERIEKKKNKKAKE